MNKADILPTHRGTRYLASVAAPALAAAALLAGVAPANSQGEQHAARAGGLATRVAELCRADGTVEQCRCYEDEVQTSLPPNELAYLPKLLTENLALEREARRLDAQFRRQEPAAGFSDSFSAGLYITTRRAAEKDAAYDRLAREMGDASAFRHLVATQDAADTRCNVGGTGAPPEAPAAVAAAPPLSDDPETSLRQLEGAYLATNYSGTPNASETWVIGAAPLRSGPGLDTAIVGYLRAGTLGVVDGHFGKWIKIHIPQGNGSGPIIGYIVENFLYLKHGS